MASLVSVLTAAVVVAIGVLVAVKLKGLCDG
jgi:hypothetical protein